MLIKYYATLNNKIILLSIQHNNKSSSTLPLVKQNSIVNLWSVHLIQDEIHYLKLDNNFAVSSKLHFPNIIVLIEIAFKFSTLNPFRRS